MKAAMTAAAMIVVGDRSEVEVEAAPSAAVVVVVVHQGDPAVGPVVQVAARVDRDAVPVVRTVLVPAPHGQWVNRVVPVARPT